MTSKQVAVGVAVVLAVAVAGYFFFSNMPPQDVNQENSGNTTTNNSNSAKINIDAVCQGALAYMTFADAVSAEVFVAECKEGKHPEVIEQYKASLQTDGKAI